MPCLAQLDSLHIADGNLMSPVYFRCLISTFSKSFVTRPLRPRLRPPFGELEGNSNEIFYKSQKCNWISICEIAIL